MDPVNGANPQGDMPETEEQKKAREEAEAAAATPETTPETPAEGTTPQV
ncbi:MAG: hypothetical protein Q8O98_00585 [bacterium]|nr:hypothetical protein [bacterium]